MQKNYVQIRFQSCKSDATIGMLKHNTRTQKPHYLRNSMAHNKENNTLFIFNNNVETIENNTQIKQHYMQLKKQLMDYQETLLSENRNFRIKKHALTQDSIITLSNSINDMYENGEITKKELDNLFLKSIKEIEKELGLVAMYGVVHYDEKTPHLHISFQAYNKNNEKWVSVDSRGKLKKQYSKAQDLVGNVFSKIGFKRGKKGSKNRHLSVQEMHQKELENKLKQIENIKTYDNKKIIQPTKKIIKKDIEYRDGLLGNTYTKLTTSDIKKIDTYINQQNNKIKNLKKQVKPILINKNDLLDIVNIKKTKNELIREKEKIEIEINDYKNAIENLENEQDKLKKKIILSKNDLLQTQQQEKEIKEKIKEIENENEQLKKEINSLKNEIEIERNINININEIENENKQLKNDNENLMLKNKELENENYDLKLDKQELQEKINLYEKKNDKSFYRTR